MYEIIVGRDESDRKKIGEEATIYLGKLYVKMGATTSLSNKVLMDVARSHVVLISGKRGSGKSFSMGVVAEEMISLPEEVSQNLSVLIFDTMGIFWTMKYQNEKEADLLEEWGLKPRSLKNINIFTPKGYYQKYKDENFPTDFSFAIKPNEITAGDWCNVFNIQLTDSLGVLIEKILEQLEEKDYDLKDILEGIRKDKRTDDKTKAALENRFIAAMGWGLFDKDATPLKQIVDSGKVSILDVSCYNNVSGSSEIKNLVIGLVCRKLFLERMSERKKEELETIERGYSPFFEYEDELKKEKMPLVWILLDEAHECLPKEGTTPATDSLVQLLREGRQPGISLILATQQPGEIHKDVMTQSDIVLSHRITSRKDIDALNSIMQSYSAGDIMRYLNELPSLKGSAIVLDDNSERIYPIRVRPRFTWHGGESPTAIKIKRKEMLNLGL